MNAIKSPLTLDLNNLFRPAIPDGIESLDGYEAAFSEIHHGVNALRSTGQLAFSRLPDDIRMQSEILAAAEKYTSIKNIVVFGIGGSALGAKSIYHALHGPFATLTKSPRFFMIDNIDPQVMDDLAILVKGEKTLFVLISKSGNTSETLAQYLFIKRAIPKIDSDDIFIITDPSEGCLRNVAKKNHHPSLTVPPGVGGRFSVFSAVGLFPLAVAGVDIEMLLDGARHAEKACRESVLERNPAALLACTLDYWCREKNASQMVVMPYSDRLALFSDWVAQLFAESLNKHITLSGKSPAYGLTLLKALGVTDQHSQLQLYLDGPRDKVVYFVTAGSRQKSPLAEEKSGDDNLDFLAGKSLAELLYAEKRATEESLRENARPNATVAIEEISEFQLGQLYQVFMNVIPYLGGLLDINPYDQPAVERIKKFTFGLMGKTGYEDFTQKLADNPKRDNLIF